MPRFTKFLYAAVFGITLIGVLSGFAASKATQKQKPLPPVKTPFNNQIGDNQGPLPSGIGFVQGGDQSIFPQSCQNPFRFPIDTNFTPTSGDPSGLDLDDVDVPQIFQNIAPLTPIQQLGKFLVFDTVLSDPFPDLSQIFGLDGGLNPQNAGKFFIPDRDGLPILRRIDDLPLNTPLMEACATCHKLETGFMAPTSLVNATFGGVMPGAVHGRVGKRLPPSFAYIVFNPIGPFQNGTQNNAPNFLGGIMWDGRFRSPLDLGAAVDPNEMGNISTPSNAMPPLRQGFSPLLAHKIPHRPYAKLWLKVFGAHDLNFGWWEDGEWHPLVDPKNPFLTPPPGVLTGEERVFTHFVKAIDAYLTSRDVNQFTSKYDAVIAGAEINGVPVAFTPQEQQGHDLFFGTAGCSNCHSSAGVDPTSLRNPIPGGRELFTAMCFVNTGIPANPNNPFYKEASAVVDPLGANPATPPSAFIDTGLALNAFPGTDGTVFLNQDFAKGLFLVPTLRNVNRRPNNGFVKSFGHNGFFKSLEDFVHFDNVRNVAFSDATGLPAFTVNLLTDLPLPAGFHLAFPLPENLNANLQNFAGNTPANADDSSIGTNGELGNLGLTAAQEAAIVAFLKTLDDGFLLELATQP